MMRGVRARTVLLVLALAAAGVALAYRSSLQVWAYGVGEGSRPLVGRAAPALPAPVARRTLDGGPAVDLAALRGKVVLLHFWTFG